MKERQPTPEDQPRKGETVRQWQERRDDECSYAMIDHCIPVVKIKGGDPPTRHRGSKLRAPVK